MCGLKLSHSQFLHAHTTTFNPKDVDIDGTHPEEITEALYELREKNPTEDALHIFAMALRKRGTEADIDAAANFHQYLLAIKILARSQGKMRIKAHALLR